MENNIKRPISVLIAQILLVLSASPLVVIWLGRVALLAINLSPHKLLLTTVSILLPILFGLPLLVAVWGMAKRKPYVDGWALL